jgi:hypothetical protein
MRNAEEKARLQQALRKLSPARRRTLEELSAIMLSLLMQAHEKERKEREVVSGGERP